MTNLLFQIFIILIFFWGPSLQNRMDMMPDENVISQCFSPTYNILYLCIIPYINKLRIIFIEKLLLVLLIFTIFISVIIEKSANLGMCWNLIVIPILLNSYFRCVKDNKQINKIRNIIIYFFIVECTCAIYEGINQTILIDTSEFATVDIMGDFRARAFHGHGLQNSFIVVILGMSILFSTLKSTIKYSLFILGGCSLMAFNTRSGFLIYTFILFIYFYRYLFSSKNVNTKSKVLFISSCILVLFIVSIFINDIGLGSRLSKGVDDDGGSADIRFTALYYIISLSPDNLIFGSTNLITKLLSVTGIGIIENSFIIVLLSSGVIFLITYLILIYKIFRLLISNKFLLKLFSIVLFALYNVNNIISTSVPSMVIVFIAIHVFIVPSFKEKSDISDSIK